MKRKKRLKKGIESLDEQIILHELKRAQALAAKNDGLVKYYDGELEDLRNYKAQKKRKLGK